MYSCRNVIIAGFDNTRAEEIVRNYYDKLKESIRIKRLAITMTQDVSKGYRRDKAVYHLRIAEHIVSEIIPLGTAELIIAKDIVAAVDCIEYLKTDGRILLEEYPVKIKDHSDSRTDIRELINFIEEMNINTGRLI